MPSSYNKWFGLEAIGMIGGRSRPVLTKPAGDRHHNANDKTILR
jgi:hypothetical protein